MGGRGSSSGRGKSSGARTGSGTQIEQSAQIYNQFLEQGLNSKIKGIRKKAIEGTGNYSFKNASPVAYDEALTMGSTTQVFTRGENTLVAGYTPDGKYAYFAGKTNSQQIQTLIEKRKSKVDTSPNLPDNMRTTTTYDRWRKRNMKNFDAYYYGASGMKNKR